MSEKTAVANYETLLKLFTTLEPGSTLSDVDKALSDNLSDFLNEHIVAEQKPVTDIEAQFSEPQIPEEPEFVSRHTRHLLHALIKDSVHTSSPYFIGHMTSALPSFHLSLSKLLVGLNQNLVKVETSKAFTPMER